MTYNFPVVISAAGAVPQSIGSLSSQLFNNVAAVNPGYTILPGGIIEDVSSTIIGAVSLCDQARVAAINSLTPYGANEPLLTQLGNVYGVPINQATNTSVYVVFSGTPGFVISAGFVVSDGTNQYVIPNDGGGIIGTSGSSLPLYVVSNQVGSWPVPPASVTQLVTSVPLAYSVTVSNPSAGIPGVVTGETQESYRSRVLLAGNAPCGGSASNLKTLLYEVSGVQKNLVSIVQQGAFWEVICGGGDPYQVAYSIFSSGLDISRLIGSQLSVYGITQATNGIVATNYAHGLSTGAVIKLTNIVGMTALNGVSLTITVLSPTTFETNVNTSSYSPYISGGTISPNPRNEIVSIIDFPDTYQITYVLPPQQTVTMTVTWQSISPNYVANATIAGLAQPSIASYINSIAVGQPMNILQISDAFTSVLPTSIPESSISLLAFQIYVDGILSVPSGNLIYADPESSFTISNANINVVNA
jgi:hypothetical protein